jgi:hypothetical protein
MDNIRIIELSHGGCFQKEILTTFFASIGLTITKARRDMRRISNVSLPCRRFSTLKKNVNLSRGASFVLPHDNCILLSCYFIQFLFVFVTVPSAEYVEIPLKSSLQLKSFSHLVRLTSLYKHHQIPLRDSKEYGIYYESKYVARKISVNL